MNELYYATGTLYAELIFDAPINCNNGDVIILKHEENAMNVKIGKPPEKNEYTELAYATEVAYNALRQELVKRGLLPAIVDIPLSGMGVDAEDQPVAQQWRDACRDMMLQLRRKATDDASITYVGIDAGKTPGGSL